MTASIGLRVEGPLAFVTLANSGRLNAMTRAMWRELRAVFGRLAQLPALRCVVVGGEGGAFCAGGDISEYPSFRFEVEPLRAFHEDEVWAALAAMLACELPLVACIEGACMGAGLEIASCCDIRLAAASAKFGAPIAKLGFPMAPREAALVQGAIGDVLARDMLLAAGVHGAERLREAGFLLRVLPDAELQAEVLACANRIAALAPAAARLNKATFAALRQAGAQAGVAPLLATAYDYADSAEHREGIAAFLAKRPPVF
ncbi:enoyl-CoA hydratase/isomerase family protein [Variovorax sp. J22P271]|uniref:enoyl-CoA hydratase/isomerase family protein n=1 Tax=Variovorax davisae TaxID=3053515 RepID=UPI0025763D0F|nr:enoyl-CoA hydratase/isomerase family protein [Variovorax sp. J22P271]MDM0031068.1 enoyl-CoA hydratase/isomerase family protein [Variovorax sp. J22P271]